MEYIPPVSNFRQPEDPASYQELLSEQKKDLREGILTLHKMLAAEAFDSAVISKLKNGINSILNERNLDSKIVYWLNGARSSLNQMAVNAHDTSVWIAHGMKAINDISRLLL